MKRRSFLKTGISLIALDRLGRSVAAVDNIPSIAGAKDLAFPIRPIAKPSGSHWYGYYDRLQFDPTSRYALANLTETPNRTPTKDDVVEVGYVDLEDNDRWVKIGQTTAWCWQQGCLLQWIPSSKTDIIWNDREGSQFVSRVFNRETGTTRTLPQPIYALSPDGTWAIGTDFGRIDSMRPGYGYAGEEERYYNQKAPKEIGVYRINLQTGQSNLIMSLADAARIPHKGVNVEDNFHWFNHISVNTDGTRFIFLHRWRPKLLPRHQLASGGWTTRMVTLSPDGTEPYIVEPFDFFSHFCWADSSHICVFTRPTGQQRGFYLIEDKTGKYVPIGLEKMTTDGHNTYLPGYDNQWIIGDTYPDKERYQHLYLYHVPTDRRVDVGKFYEPQEFAGEWRCDLHPRSAPCGTKIMFDSTHTGERQMWLVNLTKPLL